MAFDKAINPQSQELYACESSMFSTYTNSLVATSNLEDRPARKRIRGWSPNGRNYKRLGGDAPLFVRWENGTLEQLTHQERAMINFTRSLPDDLRSEYFKLLQKKGSEFDEALAAFDAHFQARRGEIAWPPTGWKTQQKIS